MQYTDIENNNLRKETVKNRRCTQSWNCVSVKMEEPVRSSSMVKVGNNNNHNVLSNGRDELPFLFHFRKTKIEKKIKKQGIKNN